MFISNLCILPIRDKLTYKNTVNIMIYTAIGIMSGSSLDGLDIILATFQQTADKWQYKIQKTACHTFTEEMRDKLQQACSMNLKDYLILDRAFGRYIGEEINRFLCSVSVKKDDLVIGSHGHTTFHLPQMGVSAHIGHGSCIAAVTGIKTVSGFRDMDIALSGQGAPIVPIGEKLLWSGYDYFLNLGGIANLSFKEKEDQPYRAFDVCPANRVLNLIAEEVQMRYDPNGKNAAKGTVSIKLLERLSHLDYYCKPIPKSLENSFGTDTVYPIIRDSALNLQDKLATYTEHIALEIKNAFIRFSKLKHQEGKLLISGGGAKNTFLMKRISYHLATIGIKAETETDETTDFKEALIMAFMAVLRIKSIPSVFSSVTGAKKDSVAGSIWLP